MFAGSTGTTSPHMPQGAAAGTANGDFVSDNDAGALHTFYRYFIEVPAGATKMQVDLWDADVGSNANEDVLGRDRDRGGYDTTATYRLFNPAGVAVTPRFTTGNTTLPAASDAAWLVFYSVTGNNVLDQFSTAAYTNNNGNNNWASSWTETDGGAGGATGGSILVTGGELRLQDVDTGTQSIYREADLLGTPGLNMGMATLTFAYRTSGNLEGADEVTLEVSANGGGAWTTLTTYSGNVTGTASFDITPYIGNATRIRFTVAAGEFDQNNGTEYFFVDNVQIADGPAPAAGHWELQIDQTAGGDDINAIGIRAHDGDTTSGGTEYNIYADSMVSLGVNPDGSGGNTRSYTLYPWVTAGCSCSQNDFDRDSDGGNIGSVTYTSRSAAFTQTFASGVLSPDNQWDRNALNNYTSNFYSIDYGIWTHNSTINTYVNTSGNYETLYVGNYLAAANPPTSNPLTVGGFPSVFRLYVPNDAGGAPVKPWLEQYLTRVGGPGPAPQLGVAQQYTVSVSVVNNTAHAITFSATNTVIANIPGGGTVYAGSPTFSQGSIVGALPAIGATGNITWNPATVAAGTVATLAYNITVTPAAATTPATGVATSGAGTRATYVDETGNATQARATYRLGGLCQLNVVVGLATEVALSSYDADERGHVAWDTASEAGTIGFNLLRENGTKVNDALIPAGKRHYEVDDRSMAQRYILEEVTASGRRNRYPMAGSMHRIGPDAKKNENDRPARIRASAEGSFSSEASFSSEGASKTSALVMGVRDTGIVRVPFTELATRFGSTADAIARSAEKGQFAITTGGESVSWTSTLDAILFFGEKTDSIYSRDRMYRIEVARGARMTSVPVPTSNVPLSQFDGQADFETDAFPATVLPLDPESDYWFWDYVVSGDATYGRKSFGINVPNMANASNATLEVRLQGALANASHKARVTLNGVPVGELSWTSLDGRTSTLALPAGVLRDGANDIEIEGVLAPSDPFDVFYIDGFTVRYKRFARPVNGALAATISSAMTAGPFTTAPVVLDVTDRLTPTQLTGGTFAGGHLSMVLPTLTRNVFVAQSFIAPSSYRAVASATLKNSKANYIVIAPYAMRAGAEALAALRQRDGLSTVVADLEQIYDDYNYGSPSPHAIRAFIAAMLNQPVSQRPKYVVLAGTGTVDYRGIEQAPGPVPPLMIKTADGLFASDSKLADANNNGVPDLAIGRIPVSNNSELLAYVDKLKMHTTSAVTNPIVFTADASDGTTNFGNASDDAAVPLATRPQQRYHVGEVGAEATRNGLLSAWTSGTPLVSWVGHGGLDQLASSGVLTAGDAPSLMATGRLPVLVAMTCTINRFEDGTVEPLGSALTRQPNGGALAVWSATGLSNHENAREMQRTFMKLAAAKPQLRLGELIVQTLTAHPSDTAGIYVLLGDPAITLDLPKEITNVGTPIPSGE
jgi:hypothetical protein